MATCLPGERETVGAGFAAPRSALAVADGTYRAYLMKASDGSGMHLEGIITAVNPAAVLNPLVHAAHAQVIEAGGKEVRVDLTRLEFCNSFGFQTFIHWIDLIQAAPQAQRYKLHFLCSKERRWQQTRLLALSCHGVDVVVIEAV